MASRHLMFPLSFALGIALLLSLHSFSAVAQGGVVCARPGSAGRPCHSRPRPTFDCGTVTEIPQAECQALVALYDSTGGAGWLHRDGWLVSNTPCSWYGVTCPTTDPSGAAGQQPGGALRRTSET